MTAPAICTCQWSPVDTTTADPPHIVARDPDCPRHGDTSPAAQEARENEIFYAAIRLGAGAQRVPVGLSEKEPQTKAYARQVRCGAGTMSSPAIDKAALQSAPSPIDVLELRAWARAYLWAIGEYELAEAIDPLAEFARLKGIDANTAQKILAEQFAPFREAEL